jgi:hypothetical protein
VKLHTIVMALAISNMKRLFWVALSLVFSISTAKAVTCEQFVARVMEGAAYYKVPVPQFDLEWVNPADADWRAFKITTFGDVRAIMFCRHGWVDTFAVDANDSEGMSTVHVSALTAVGLYGDGLTWQEAIAMRDQLMREAKPAHVAELTIDGAKASLIISIVGVASFQIDNAR